MFRRIRSVLPLALLAAAACTSSTNALGPEEEEETEETPPAPAVTLVAPADLPLWDSLQYKSSCQTESRACPVVTWQEVDYVALSYLDNRASFAIHAYDAAGALLGVSEGTGARYLSAVRVDTAGRSVTFIGQDAFEVTRSWTQLEAIR